MAPTTGRMRAGTIVALLAVATACGSDGGTAGPSAPTTSSAPARDSAAFCAAWQDGAASPTDEQEAELLRLVPAELADAARVLQAADGSESDPETDAAAQEIFKWVAINCPTESARRVAPPADAMLPGLRICSAGSFPMPDATGTVAMPASYYGERARPDPYDGPMLGVFSTKAGNGGFAGDGDPTHVTVRGRKGVSAPITVFQQAVVPELGTVVTWNERGQDVAIVGRLWPKARTAELIALADRLEIVDGRFTLPRDALPAGYESVFSGRYREEWSPVVSGLLADYHVRYMTTTGKGMITVAGAQTPREDFDAARFFEFPITRERIGDHDALVGSIWSENDGPWVARWREPDGFVIAVTGIGADRDDVLTIARQSRDLDHDEWKRVVSLTENCPLPIP